ncbi:MAG: potassium channel family protein [Thermoplasmatota archaeon]|nr:potassium channel family protein [Candidatus Thermoplasmatota archaeon]
MDRDSPRDSLSASPFDPTMRLNIFGWTNLRLQMIVAFSALTGLIVLGTIVYHQMEHWNWVSSFYFSVCTITTVGYGDLTPTTDASRLFTAFYALVGVGIAFTSLGIIGANYLRRSQEILLNVRSGLEASSQKKL